MAKSKVGVYCLALDFYFCFTDSPGLEVLPFLSGNDIGTGPADMDLFQRFVFIYQTCMQAGCGERIRLERRAGYRVE